MKSPFLNSVQLQRPDSNMFDLSHDVRMTNKVGTLYPCLALECVPGDKVNLSGSVFVRFMPMIAPVMHRFDVYVHYFAVPMRILWDGWESFIVNDTDNPTALPYVPISEATDPTIKRFMRDFGIAPVSPGNPNTYQISALPFAAYQACYNEYYRDQDLVDEVNYKLEDGNNITNGDLLQYRLRAYEHDYFTAEAPWAQKGAPVTIPIGNVVLNESVGATGGPNPSFDVVIGGGSTAPTSDAGSPTTTIGGPSGPYIVDGNADPLFYNPRGSLVVEATTINELRLAYRLQEWLERNAVGGTRYIEHILAHFGVRSSDKRLQRPEYICGVKSPVVISEVLNTTGTEDLPQGNMSGHAVSLGNGNFGTYYAEEHCYIIGIMSVLPKTQYQQGIPRHFLKNDPFDFYWPKFAHLGEQPVYNCEVYADHTLPMGTFGYMPAYSDYRVKPSYVSGDLCDSLSYWTLTRIFEDPPQLNQAFIECAPEHATRIFAVQDGTDYMITSINHQIRARRPIPVYGTPMT